MALLAEPVRWLVHTWAEPAYASEGWLFVLLAAVLAARGVSSGAASPDDRGLRGALALFALTAAVRLGGRVLDLDLLGAFALAADAVALGRLLALDRRPVAVAPWALGGLVALSLPIEHALQQLVSWPLRVASAATVAALPGITREGTVLVGPGGPLSVEVACSGATGLVALGVLAFAVAARRTCGPRGLFLGTLAVLGGAWLANALRLLLLVLVPAFLHEPAHTATGLLALAVGAVPALLLARSLPERAPLPPSPPATFALPAAAEAAFSVAAGLVALAPARPADVSRPVGDVALPGVIGGWTSIPEPLADVERAYYARFGGRVERRTYDSGHTVLLVRTTAPLRHLHSPDACLRGAGHAVERLGVRAGVVPTVVWRTVDDVGRAWRVEASFVSDRGGTATSASEVAWRWLADPGAAWSLVERVSPWTTCEADPAACAALDEGLFRSLELLEDPCSSRS